VNPWIRLDCGFDDDDWLYDEDPLVRFAWECFLRYVRMNSTGGGRTAARSAKLLNDKFRFGHPKWFERMLEVAKANDKLREDGGQWIVKNWERYQEPSTERTRAYKERQKQGGTPGNEGNIREQREPGEPTKTKTKTNIEKTPTVSKRKPADVAECLAFFNAKGFPSGEAEKFFCFYEANGWVQGKSRAPIKNWEAAATGWVRRAAEFNVGPTVPPPERQFKTITELPDESLERRS